MSALAVRTVSAPAAWDRRLRWAVLALQALAAAALLVVLPRRAAWINGGILFAAYLGIAGWLLAAAGAWARGSLRGLSWPVLLLSPLVGWLFYLGTEASAAGVVNFMSLPYFSVATLLWAALGARADAPARKPAPGWAQALLVLAFGLAVGAAVIGIRAWARNNLVWPEDKTSLTMLLMTRFNGAATDIDGDVFRQDAWFWAVGLFAAAFAGLFALRRSLGTQRSLVGLFGLALLGKLALAGLSTQGLAVIPLKISSINTNFFTISKVIDTDGLYAFLRDFNAHQTGLGFHADTHPPVAVLLYWLLRHVSAGSPLVTAIYVMALSALALWPVQRAVARVAGDDAGLAAAALFVTSPMSLILGNAGVDSMALTAVAFSTWLLAESVLDGKLREGVGAGACMGLAGLLSFGANASLVFLGTWGLLLAWRQGGGWEAFGLRSARVWGAFLAGLLAVHGALWLLSGTHFSYLTGIRTAQFVHMQANQYRPFELWSWANALLYAAYAGAGLMGLWLLQLGRSLFFADTRDSSAVVSAAFVLTVLLAAFGRAEVQRQFLFGTVFLLLPAAQALPRDAEDRLLPGALAVALALNLLNAVLLQVNVLDYW